MGLLRRVFHLILTTNGKLSTLFEDGDDGSAQIPLSWAQPADILQVQQGTTPSFNVRQFLTEPSPGAATITLDVTPVGWQFDGTNLNYQGSIGVGLTTTVRPSATFSSTTVASPFTFKVEVIPSQSLDTTAPVRVYGFKTSLDPQGVLLSGYPSCDPAVGTTEASGGITYLVERDDVQIATIPPQIGGITPKLIGRDIGAVALPGNTVQSGADYTLTSFGQGLGGTLDQFQVATMPVSGDFTLIAYIEGITGDVNAATQALLIARENSNPDARAMLYRLNPTGGRMRARGAVGAATTTVGSFDGPTWPGYMLLERKGDTWSARYSSAGDDFSTVIATGTLALPASLEVGLATGVGAAGSVVMVARAVLLQNQNTISYLDVIADGRVHTYRIRPKDAAGNVGVASTLLTQTAPAAADTTAPTVPVVTVTAASQAVLNVSWSPSADAESGVDLYFIQSSNVDAGPWTDEAPLAGQPGTTYTKGGLAASTTKSFRVRVKDKAGNFSDFSLPAHGTTLPAPPVDVTPPTVPGSPSAVGVSSTQVKIDFTPSTDTQSGVGGYRLWVAPASVGPFSLDPAVISGAPYTWTGGQPDTPYWFQLDAFDGVSPTPNRSARTAIFTARTLASNLIITDLHYDDMQGAYDAGKPNQPGGSSKRWQIADDYDFGVNPILDYSNKRARFGTKSARAELNFTNAAGNTWLHSSPPPASETPFRNEWNAANGSAWPVTGWNRRSVLHTLQNNIEYWSGYSIFLPAAGDSNGDPSYPLNSVHPSFCLVAQWHGSGESGSDARNPMSALFISGPDPITGFKARWSLTSLSQKTFDSQLKVYDSKKTYDLGPIAPDQGHWVDFVHRNRWDYSWTTSPSDGTSRGIIQVWKNGVLVVNQINFPNSYNNTNVGYPACVGFYTERVNYTTNPNPQQIAPGMPVKIVGYWGEWKYASVVGNPQAPVDTSNAGYQRVAPRGVRPL